MLHTTRAQPAFASLPPHLHSDSREDRRQPCGRAAAIRRQAAQEPHAARGWLTRRGGCGGLAQTCCGRRGWRRRRKRLRTRRGAVGRPPGHARAAAMTICGARSRFRCSRAAAARESSGGPACSCSRRRRSSLSNFNSTRRTRSQRIGSTQVAEISGRDMSHGRQGWGSRCGGVSRAARRAVSRCTGCTTASTTHLGSGDTGDDDGTRRSLVVLDELQGQRRSASGLDAAGHLTHRELLEGAADRLVGARLLVLRRVRVSAC
jgi:hypothetical protein